MYYHVVLALSWIKYVDKWAELVVRLHFCIHIADIFVWRISGIRILEFVIYLWYVSLSAEFQATIYCNVIARVNGFPLSRLFFVWRCYWCWEIKKCACISFWLSFHYTYPFQVLKSAVTRCKNFFGHFTFFKSVIEYQQPFFELKWR